ncbi:helix-turn-helix transcriptional regulator [uncultured Novosphingobium sp.]|uniref:helix-turn-helix transcriptional regulator n=1 Tax=uncultured Novosphingobium sp. TaxID=292277 RepID=UPI002594338A|nr:helix-turn-helix transcriptional regulator [uncultured Novosphingobium sp.]
MSVGARLREERQRLGLSQERFAALAGVAKNTAINWEKEKSSPTAAALLAFAEAGADALYILTGKHSAPEPDIFVSLVNSDLEEVELDLLDPKRHWVPGENEEDLEKRVLSGAITKLERILKSADPVSEEQSERVKALLDAAYNPAKLALLRATDFAQKRKRREEEEELLGIWLNDSPYQPDHAPMKLMVMLAIEYGVPHRTLVELCQEIAEDVREQDWADTVIRHDEAALREE